MIRPSVQRALFQLTAAILISTVAGPALAPASAAPAPNPDSPKGKFTGTYVSDDGMHTGSVTLTITQEKTVPGSPIHTVKGKLTLLPDVRNKTVTGSYVPEGRQLSVGTLVIRGTAAGLGVTLSLDGKTLTGQYGTNTVPGGGNNIEGTVTLTRSTR